ncbi:cholesterol 25-hydroxylase-like protein 1, member 1 [Rhinoraja longicauda]
MGGNSTLSPAALQPLWDQLCLHHGWVLRSPALPVLLSLSGYLAFCLPFSVADLLGPWLPRWPGWKLQGWRPGPSPMARCLSLALSNHLLLALPAAALRGWWDPSAPLPRAAPTLCQLLAGALSCLLVFDLQYYVWHVVHHASGRLYWAVHSPHHRYTAPFSLASQQLGPGELLAVSFWSTTTPLILKVHPLAAWLSMVLSVWLSVEDHVGYDLPWGLHRLVPGGLVGGSPAHDLHHQHPSTNFAPFFTHLDRAFGTAYSDQKHLTPGTLQW